MRDDAMSLCRWVSHGLASDRCQKGNRVAAALKRRSARMPKRRSVSFVRIPRKHSFLEEWRRRHVRSEWFAIRAHAPGFLKSTGTAMGVVAAAGVAGPSMTALAAQEGDAQGSGNEEQLFSCMCRSNCMGSCRYYAHVRDGKLMKLTPAEYPVEGYRGKLPQGPCVHRAHLQPDARQVPHAARR